MNSVAFQEPSSTNQPAAEFQYRSISKAAVAALVFAIMGLTSFLSPVFTLLPALGVGFAIVALANIGRFPDELVGKGAAKIGLVVSLICLVSSVAMHAYIYATEVPENYQRISFSMLRDNSKTALPFSEKAKTIDGKKVFLKGYVRPGDKRTNLKNFILVGDFGDCCFGGNPKITDVVAIKILGEDTTVDHSFALRRIGGVFRLNPQRARTSESEIPQVFYEIEADHVK